jgi:hypothetical protein
VVPSARHIHIPAGFSPGWIYELVYTAKDLRWTRKIGQEVKLGLLLRRTDLNDGQTEAVFGGFQGEGCS